ncbi:MAG: DUF262 domain-containing protein [Nitrospirae bacterium]|nr:DUF262 domain-containing protein [Nitrospirota bacterium]
MNIDEPCETTEDNVEKEDVGDSKITAPYDPDTIKVNQQNTNLGFLIEMLQEGEIDLMPDFQRSGNLWSKIQKSQLIESLLLGLPLPSFYFSEDEKSKKWLVVDGLQRLCTFNDFIINNKFKLSGLEFLNKEDYEGKTYNELTRADKRKISGTKINFYVIEKQTPPAVKFILFKRVNTGGLVLNPQEIRHALNQGIPATFIKELAELEEFKRYKISSERMEDREFVNRFVAFSLLGCEKYSGEMEKFLSDGIIELKNTSESKRAQIKEAFRKSMKLSYEIFGDDAFKMRFNSEIAYPDIFKELFDTISVNIAWLSDEQQNLLLNKKADVLSEFTKITTDDKEFIFDIVAEIYDEHAVKRVFEKIKNLLKKLLESS